MKINPTRIKWKNPNAYPVDIELGVVQPDDTVAPLMSLPGSLNADGFYEAPIEPTPLDDVDGEYTIALRAIDPSRETENVSSWSSAVTFEIRNEVPAPPLSVTVE